MKVTIELTPGEELTPVRVASAIQLFADNLDITPSQIVGVTIEPDEKWDTDDALDTVGELTKYGFEASVPQLAGESSD